ncbi:MAG: DUF2975 domain-containing protein [Clostridia bacterium]|nr:DUF2975 domain-containing protein [Clostridia bacterium]
MKKMTVSNRTSSIISLILAILLIPALLFVLWWLPDVVGAMLDTPDHLGDRANMQDWERTAVLVAAYLIVAVAFVTVGFLIFLLRLTLSEAVFSQKTLTVLLCLSICCFVIAALFGYVGIYFQLAFCVALAALCLGVSLRVVKNVIAEAMRYKSENDLTI